MYEAGVFQGYKSLKDFYELSLWGKFWFKIIVMLSTAILLILPLNLLKDIGKLRFSSMLGVISLIVLMIILKGRTTNVLRQLLSKL